MAEAVTKRRQVKGEEGARKEQMANREVLQDRQIRDTGETEQVQKMYSLTLAYHDMTIRNSRLVQVAHAYGMI